MCPSKREAGRSMPWKETGPMMERGHFVLAVRKETRSFAGLCGEFGISRKTGYKWMERFNEDGWRGLEDRSRAPHHPANSVPESLKDLFVAERKQHPTWGPRKLLARLKRRSKSAEWPAASTIGELLKREGLVKPRRRHARCVGPSGPRSPMNAPNDVWCADFKGQFRTRDGRYCYPLTISDGYSRFLLSCTGLRNTTSRASRPIFERSFRDYGLPQAILTDNGEPFASVGVRRLSRLSVWWIKLGIHPEQIEPRHPEQNGRHERIHRTLKAETTRPPALNLAAQQRRFDAFQREYNVERPHEALAYETPATAYAPSSRSYPRRLEEIEYPGHYEVRQVMASGAISWKCDLVYVHACLAGERVGLLEVADGIWRVHFSRCELGVFDARTFGAARGTGKSVSLEPA